MRADLLARRQFRPPFPPRLLDTPCIIEVVGIEARGTRPALVPVQTKPNFNLAKSFASCILQNKLFEPGTLLDQDELARTLART